MGQITLDTGVYETMWCSHVDFDGIRLEVSNLAGQILFDVSVPEAGPVTVNTFSNEVPAALIAVAVETARMR